MSKSLTLEETRKLAFEARDEFRRKWRQYAEKQAEVYGEPEMTRKIHFDTYQNKTGLLGCNQVRKSNIYTRDPNMVTCELCIHAMAKSGEEE